MRNESHLKQAKFGIKCNQCHKDGRNKATCKLHTTSTQPTSTDASTQPTLNVVSTYPSPTVTSTHPTPIVASTYPSLPTASSQPIAALTHSSFPSTSS